MKKTYYTEELLERDLGEFEDRYGWTSAAFYEVYSGERPELARVSSHDCIVWASLYGALCRLRGASPQAALQAAG